MSIWDQIRKSVSAAANAAANAVKNAQGNSTPTVDTSYGANTPSAPVVGATVGAGVVNAANAVAGAVNGAYNGMTYGDYIAGSQSDICSHFFTIRCSHTNLNDGSFCNTCTLYRLHKGRKSWMISTKCFPGFFHFKKCCRVKCHNLISYIST